MPDIQGIIQNISHVFYLSGDSKCFFIQVDEDFVLIRLSGLRRTADLDPILVKLQTDPNCYYGRTISIQQVSKRTIKLEDNSHKVLLYSDKSSIRWVNEETSQPMTSSNLVTYEGTVTNDQCVKAGIFMLDKKVLVIMSALCVITNVSPVENGQKIVIRNAHLKKYGENRVGLILCAKSRIIPLNQESTFHISKAAMKMFESNLIIQHCLNLKLSAKQIFAFYNTLDHLESLGFGSDWKSKYLLDALAFPQDVLDFLDFDVEKVPGRSLLNEFLSKPHRCSVDKDDGSHQWPLLSQPLRHVWQTSIQPHITILHEELESNKNPCRYRFLKESFNVHLIGNFEVEAKSGFYLIRDRSHHIILVFTPKSTLPKLNSLVKITKYLACSEYFGVNGKSWTLEYVIVHEFKVLPSDQSQEIISEHNFHVQLMSHPMKMGNNKDDAEMSHILAVLSKQHNEEKFLRIPAKLGMDFTSSTLIKCNFSETEKYSPTLHKFLKSKLIQERPAKIIDVTEVQVLERKYNTNNEVYQIQDLYQLQDNELINVEGILAEKWLELSKYYDPNSDQLMSQTDLELKLKDEQGTRISLYVTKWDTKANILGLIPGLRIRCNNVTKATSRKNNVYLVTTFFSNFQVLDSEPPQDPLRASNKVSQVENEGKNIQFLALNKGNLQAIYCLLSLEKVIKVSISANCKGCNNAVKNGVCSFVGCHADPVSVEFTQKASFIVEDASERIFLVCNQESDIQTILQLSDADWKACQSQAKKSGELLYLNGRLGAGAENTDNVFDTYCQMYPQSVLSQFHCLCRSFKSEEKTDHGLRKYYCIEVKSK